MVKISLILSKDIPQINESFVIITAMILSLEGRDQSSKTVKLEVDK